MLLALIQLTTAADATQLQVGVQSTINDPFMSTTMGTLSLRHDLKDWLAIEAGGGLSPLPPQATWKALTTHLDTQGIWPDMAYLRGMAWTGARISPVQNTLGPLHTQVGVHLGVATLYSVEADLGYNGDSKEEFSAAGRYGVHGTLGWERWGLELAMTRTRHDETFETSPGYSTVQSRQNIWVHGGLTCRL